MDKQNYRQIVVAIDFGTTYSGFGFAEANVIGESSIQVFRGWGRGQGFSFYKTPSCVLLNPDGSFCKFGHAAVETYTKALAKGDNKDFIYFERFKLILYNTKNLSKDTSLMAANGAVVKALDLFSVCLAYLGDKAMEYVNTSGQRGSRTYQPTDVQWVITVPAIWEPTAKEFMREAAYKAGLASPDDPDQLLIALEPEAASFYCRTLQMKDFLGESGDEFVNEGLASYIVIDNGGGTLDITVHEIQEDGTIHEIHCPAGGDIGGMHVDREFQRMLFTVFSEDFINKFRRDFPNDWQKIMNDFEIQKRAEQGVDSDEVSIVLPFNFVNAYSRDVGSDENINERLLTSYKNNEVTVSNGYLSLSLEVIRHFFEPVVEKTIDAIKSLLRQIRHNDVNTMFLVGGFSQALPLRKAFAQVFPDKRVLTPRDAELAIIKGAVMFAQSPDLLTTRIMAKTYGIDINEVFDASKHPEEKKTEICGIIYCEDIFDILVKEDEKVNIGEKRSFFFSPVHPEQTTATLRFFSTHNTKTQFVTDPGVIAENVGFQIITPDVTKGLRRNIELNIYFGGTEIKVTATDVASGTSAKAALRLVTKKLS
ncbi:heat shock 70 kDa protein 12A-like [Montipora foliosa]|uniref:heat shock 70 kDa protein 12A-like n=1 Tax=Montipora foliosa TaxID=591990 RepID=UPI0035F13388